ncbi:hypothetical protein L1987_14240 [Smallanthus sonchifolius]|uniref:Uncharacterized protein n=1 Tax=Smallanthus sonchifolius TaxID=185202 RepID=A0ACB9J498_9ASTR|nr:hypothetical protein L1987_14240 [Smallanthus sonchifolius]
MLNFTRAYKHDKLQKEFQGALCSCLLPESLEATTVKQLPEYYTYEDDGSDSGSSSSGQEASETDEFDQKVLLSPTSVEIAFIRDPECIP